MSRRPPSVAVLGGGSWGTTVASLAAQNTETTLWARSPEVAAEITEEHRNSRYLPDLSLTESLRATADLAEAVTGADVLVMAVPSQSFRAVLTDAVEHVRPWIPVVSLVKGLEQGSRRRMTEIVAEVMPGHPAGVLAGPNIAAEVLRGYAAAATIAMPDQRSAEMLQELFRTKLFRVYTSTDVIGVELAGALRTCSPSRSASVTGLRPGTTPGPWSSPAHCVSFPGSAWRWAGTRTPSPVSPAWVT